MKFELGYTDGKPTIWNGVESRIASEGEIINADNASYTVIRGRWELVSVKRLKTLIQVAKIVKRRLESYTKSRYASIPVFEILIGESFRKRTFINTVPVSFDLDDYPPTFSISISLKDKKTLSTFTTGTLKQGEFTTRLTAETLAEMLSATYKKAEAMLYD